MGLKSLLSSFSSKLSFVTKFDFWFISKIVNIRRKSLTLFFRFISTLGDWWVLFLITTFVLFFVEYNLGIMLALALIVQTLFQKTAKNIATRKRPYIKHKNKVKRLINPPDRYSFPSGHTAGAFVLFFSVSNFYTEISIPILILSVLVGFSRIYLGVHYLTDVLVGIILGFVSVEITKTFYLYVASTAKQLVPYLLHLQLYLVGHHVFV